MTRPKTPLHGLPAPSWSGFAIAIPTLQTTPDGRDPQSLGNRANAFRPNSLR
jgi:hypothetical protein